MSISLISKKFGALLSKQMNSVPTTAVAVRSMSVTKNTMNRRDLAAIVAQEHEMSTSKAEKILKTVFDTIVEVKKSIFRCYHAALSEKNSTH